MLALQGDTTDHGHRSPSPTPCTAEELYTHTTAFKPRTTEKNWGHHWTVVGSSDAELAAKLDQRPQGILPPLRLSQRGFYELVPLSLSLSLQPNEACGLLQTSSPAHSW